MLKFVNTLGKVTTLFSSHSTNTDISVDINNIGVGVRQTVRSGSVDTNGQANFLQIGTGLAVNLAASAVPLVVHMAGGDPKDDVVKRVIADITGAWSGLTQSVTNYLYIDYNKTTGALTYGATPTAPVYQFGGTHSVTNGQFTFSIEDMTAWVGNGTTTTQVYRTFVGEAVTNTTNVTSVISYALNGYYDSGYTTTLPAVATQVSKNSNLGVNTMVLPRFIVECVTTDGGFAVGDILDTVLSGGASYMGRTLNYTKNTVSITSGGTTAWMSLNKTTGANFSLTAANWKYKFIVSRGW